MKTISMVFIAEAWPVILKILNFYNKERLNDLLRDEDFLNGCQECGFGHDPKNCLTYLIWEIETLLKITPKQNESGLISLELLSGQWQIIQCILDTEYNQLLDNETVNCGDNYPYSGNMVIQSVNGEFSLQAINLATNTPGIDQETEQYLELLEYLHQEIETFLWGAPEWTELH